jgi:hypothetical protein
VNGLYRNRHTQYLQYQYSTGTTNIGPIRFPLPLSFRHHTSLHGSFLLIDINWCRMAWTGSNAANTVSMNTAYRIVHWLFCCSCFQMSISCYGQGVLQWLLTRVWLDWQYFTVIPIIHLKCNMQLLQHIDRTVINSIRSGKSSPERDVLLKFYTAGTRIAGFSNIPHG